MAQKIEKILKFIKATRHFSPYYIVEVTKVWLMNIHGTTERQVACPFQLGMVA